jgi:hypothetical protein
LEIVDIIDEIVGSDTEAYVRRVERLGYLNTNGVKSAGTCCGRCVVPETPHETVA